MKLNFTPLLRNNRERGTISGRLLRWFVLALISIAVLLGWIWSYAVTPGPLQDENGVVVLVRPDTGFEGIRIILVSAGVIEADPRFAVMARMMGVANRLKAGEYHFTAGQTPYQVLRKLEAGLVFQRPVTIPEGANMYQVANALAELGFGSRDHFLALMRDADFIAELGLQTDSLEGYLFPDTYYFSRGQNEKKIIGRMVGRFKEVYERISKKTTGAEHSLSTHEILTLASIVEKETGVAEERPLIARVFLNRLKKGMRLQADPTVIYGLEKFDGNLTRRDLKTATPYNTYVIRGLPRGPIGNPGKAAIEAVLHPAEESYYYFVSKNDGTHHFSKTLAEHNRAVVRYQKNKNSR